MRAPLYWGTRVLVGALATGTMARAQTVVPGAETSVQLLTMGQGDEIWERFGHNALWISNARTGAEIAYNWGLFDFAQPGFVARFLTGNTMYWMDGFDAGATIRQYESRNRAVVAQELRLTAPQRAALDELLRLNSRPENKFYRYDYFLDNCSTRLRNALDRVLGGAIRRQTAQVRTGTTFRSHTQRLLEEMPLTYAGITIALGQPADREISAWEEMFLPMRLREHLGRIRVDTGGGTLVPLVRGERVVSRAMREPERAVAGNFTRYFLGAGIGLGVLLLVTGIIRHPVARAVFATLATAWLAIGGMVGLILALAWGFTRHIFWYRNENLLLVNPLLLVLAVLVPLALRARAGRVTRDRTFRLAAGIAALSVLALLVKALPWFYQRNWEVIAFVLPVHIGLALVLWIERSRGGKAGVTMAE